MDLSTVGIGLGPIAGESSKSSDRSQPIAERPKSSLIVKVPSTKRPFS